MLIKPDEIETKTESGIELVLNEDRELAAQEYGTIIDIGPDAWYDKPSKWAKVGDRIVYSRYGGKFVRYPGELEKYVVLNDEDVLAVLGE